MLSRVKRVLVESLIGAIALGYLFAEAILNLVNVFTAPISSWEARNMYQELVPHTPATEGLIPRITSTVGTALQPALPPLATFVALLLIWYVLVRWLYFTPPERDAIEPTPNSAQVT
jgi:hypothetical protein